MTAHPLMIPLTEMVTYCEPGLSVTKPATSGLSFGLQVRRKA